jgi:hypothetical protein
MNSRQAEMLKRDLEVAGIPVETPDEIAVFHSSRGTYINGVIRTGASIKTLQELARHADPSVTLKHYAKASLFDVAGAVEPLPDLTPKKPDQEAVRATGTDGAIRDQIATNSDPFADSHAIDESRNILSINALCVENSVCVIDDGAR